MIKVWWWFVLAGLVYLAVLTVSFVVAARHPVREVPVARPGR